MELNIAFMQSFSSTQQLAIGRALERFHALSAKPNKSAPDTAELERVTDFLRPYTDEGRKATEPTPSRREQRDAKVTAENRGIVLNARKIVAAGLSGARELALHRDSAALGRLLMKPEASISAGERHELKSLKDRLRSFVGMEGRTATDNDFRVTA